MKNYINNSSICVLFLLVAIVATKCVNIKLGKIPVAHKNNARVAKINKLGLIDISGRALVDEFAYKLPRNKKGDSVIVYNPDPTYVSFSADSFLLKTKTIKDSVYLQPSGSLALDFKSQILARVGFWSMKIKSARLDTSKNAIHVKLNPWSLGIRFKKFDRFQELNKFTDENVVAVSAKVTVAVNGITSDIDKVLRKKKNLGSCTKQVYWKGKTKIIRASKNKIVFESNVQFQSWTCGILKTRLARDTKTITWDLTIEKKKNGKVNFKWNVRDVDNFPGSLEKILRDKLFGKAAFGLEKYYAEVLAVNFKKLSGSSVQATCEIELVGK
jgi:hypothetical protein